MRLHRTAGANSRSRGTRPVRLRDWSRGSVAAMDARDVRGTELEKWGTTSELFVLAVFLSNMASFLFFFSLALRCSTSSV